MNFLNRLKTRNIAFALFVLMLLVTGATSPAQAQTITPLTKDGSLYVVQQPAGGSSRVFTLNRSTSPYTLNAFTGTATGTTILNALGYNRIDGYMYVLAAPTSATAGLYRVGKASAGATPGDFNSLGAVSGLPNATYYAGAVSADGYLYVSNAATAASNLIYRINLNGVTPGTLGVGPFSATTITLDTSIQVGDFAFGSNGKLYSVALNGRTLYEITVSSGSTTGTVVSSATTGLATGVNLTVGTLFFDGANELYAYDNNGGFYLINIAAKTLTSVSTAASVSQSDGASVNDTPEYLDIVKGVGTPVQVNARTFDISYTIGVKNNGTATAANVQVNDKLSLTFSTGNPTISISSNPKLTTTAQTGVTATLNQNYNGDTDTRLFAGTDDYPSGAIVRVAFTVRVTYPTIADVPTVSQLNSAYVSSVAGTTFTNNGYTYSGSTAIPPVNSVTGEASSPGAVFPARAGDTPNPTGVTLPPIALEGRVYDDYNYGGSAGRAYNATLGMAGVADARVEIYDSTGAYQGFTNSLADGTWSFAVYTTGTYYARVVNASVASSRSGATAALIGVQTFRTNNGTAVTNEVGGRAPSVVDAAQAATGAVFNTSTFVFTSGPTGRAQTVSQVVVANTTDRNGFDFGFNFDTVVNTNDAAQGSLRQFILNSNALGNGGLAQVGQTAGQEVSIFQIPSTDPRYSANSPARIVLTTPLDAIAGANAGLTIVDGATQTTNIGNTNTANLGISSGVGTGSRSVAPLNGPEIEISGDGTLATLLTIGAASDVTVKNLAFTGQNSTVAPGNVSAIVIGGATNPTITGNVFGATTTTASPPAATTRVSEGILFGTAPVTNITIAGNVFSQLGNRAIIAGAANSNQIVNGLLIEGNQILTTGSQMSGNQTAGEALYFLNSFQKVVVRGNLFDGIALGSANSAFGDNIIEVFFNVSGSAVGGFSIEDNTLRNSRGTGITMYDNAGTGGNSNGKNIVVTRNVIQSMVAAGAVGGSGIEVLSARSVQISQNSFYNNGSLAIDLGTGFGATVGTGKGVSPNDGVKVFNNNTGNGGMDYPIFTTVQQNGADLRVIGYLGNVPTGSATFANSQIEFYLADNAPANQNGPVILGDGLSLPHGEGRTFIGTGTANGQGLFDVTLSGTALGSNQITAIAIDNTGNTSEFNANSGLIVPVAPNTVSGTVYLDANRNATFDSTESGIGISNLFVKAVLSGQTVAAQAVAVDAATGAFSFSGLAPGNYTLVLDDNATLSDITPAIPANYVGTESPNGTRQLTVSNQTILNQNFGLFNGAQISGTVFEDGGAGTGPGLGGVKINLIRDDGTIIDTTTTDASGNFSFKVPNSVGAGVLRIVEFNIAGYNSVSGNIGTTAGAYDQPTDVISFTYAAGSTYTGLKFGDARGITFVNEDAKIGTAGSSVFYPHVFTSQTAGSVSFVTTQLPTPANAGWAVVTYRDTNGNGILDGGDAQITGPVAVAAGVPITIFLQNFIPTTAANGAQDKLTVTANFTPTVGPVQSISRSDLTTVAANQGLLLTKAVDLTSARSGDTLTYTITYRNTGAEALTNLVVKDATPAYTTFVSASAATPPTGLSAPTIASPSVNAKGNVTWTFAGTLNPGQSGTVTFRVRVQ